MFYQGNWSEQFSCEITWYLSLAIVTVGHVQSVFVPLKLFTSNGRYELRLFDQEMCNPLRKRIFNLANAELNPICHLVALLGAHHILHVSGIRVKNTFALAEVHYGFIRGLEL